MKSLDEMLQSELADLAPQVKTETQYTPVQERVIAGFEDIQRFYETHGRLPRDVAGRDIFERLYAVRLERLGASETYQELLKSFDKQGILQMPINAVTESTDSGETDEELLAVLSEGRDESLTELRHVRSHVEIQAAEEIANRTRCKDFERFKPLFDEVAQDLRIGRRLSGAFGGDASVEEGDWFILDGLTAYVADVGERIRAPNGEWDARLRVVFSNRTESNLLMRSLKRALYGDKQSRRISEPVMDGLFSDAVTSEDQESGTIYVLRSQSEDAYIEANRQLIHKIGVTGGRVETRIANAEHEATYLLAPVEVVATYKLMNINRARLESLLHRFFAPARLEVTIHDRFGNPVEPREWFLVPLAAINEAVQRIQDGSITNYTYDPEQASLVEISVK